MEVASCLQHVPPACDLPSNADLLAGACYPCSALQRESGWRRDGGSGVGYSRRRKPRWLEPGPRRVAAIEIGVLNIQAGAKDVRLHLTTHVIESINATTLIIPAGG